MNQSSSRSSSSIAPAIYIDYIPIIMSLFRVSRANLIIYQPIRIKALVADSDYPRRTKQFSVSRASENFTKIHTEQFSKSSAWRTDIKAIRIRHNYNHHCRIIVYT